MVGTAATVVCPLQRRAFFSHASVVACAYVWALAHRALAYAQGVKTSAGLVAYLGSELRRNSTCEFVKGKAWTTQNWHACIRLCRPIRQIPQPVWRCSMDLS